MNKLIRIIVTTLLITSVFSCSKNSSPPQAEMAISYITGGPWHLISATNTNATGSISRYNGLPIDSINFAWGQDIHNNVVFTTMNSSIGGSNPVCNYNIKALIPGLNILCSPAWKNGYSDTLLVDVNNVTARSMVFQVRYNNSNGGGIETDSLRR